MGGNGRYRAVTGGMGVGAVAVAAAALYRPLPPAPAHYRPDVHAEYVKYSSAGGATVTAYLAYPERKDRAPGVVVRSEEHTSELQSLAYLVCRLLLEKKKKQSAQSPSHRRIAGRAHK